MGLSLSLCANICHAKQIKHENNTINRTSRQCNHRSLQQIDSDHQHQVSPQPAVLRLNQLEEKVVIRGNSTHSYFKPIVRRPPPVNHPRSIESSFSPRVPTFDRSSGIDTSSIEYQSPHYDHSAQLNPTATFSPAAQRPIPSTSAIFVEPTPSLASSVSASDTASQSQVFAAPLKSSISNIDPITIRDSPVELPSAPVLSVRTPFTEAEQASNRRGVFSGISSFSWLPQTRVIESTISSTSIIPVDIKIDSDFKTPLFHDSSPNLLIKSPLTDEVNLIEYCKPIHQPNASQEKVEEKLREFNRIDSPVIQIGFIMTDTFRDPQYSQELNFGPSSMKLYPEMRSEEKETSPVDRPRQPSPVGTSLHNVSSIPIQQDQSLVQHESEVGVIQPPEVIYASPPAVARAQEFSTKFQLEQKEREKKQEQKHKEQKEISKGEKGMKEEAHKDEQPIENQPTSPADVERLTLPVGETPKTTPAQTNNKNKSYSSAWPDRVQWIESKLRMLLNKTRSIVMQGKAKLKASSSSLLASDTTKSVIEDVNQVTRTNLTKFGRSFQCMASQFKSLSVETQLLAGLFFVLHFIVPLNYLSMDESWTCIKTTLLTYAICHGLIHFTDVPIVDALSWSHLAWIPMIFHFIVNPGTESYILVSPGGPNVLTDMFAFLLWFRINLIATSVQVLLDIQQWNYALKQSEVIQTTGTTGSEGGSDQPRGSHPASTNQERPPSDTSQPLVRPLQFELTPVQSHYDHSTQPHQHQPTLAIVEPKF